MPRTEEEFQRLPDGKRLEIYLRSYAGAATKMVAALDAILQEQRAQRLLMEEMLARAGGPKPAVRRRPAAPGPLPAASAADDAMREAAERLVGRTLFGWIF